jgi:uncharacterized protein (TIGR02246 family)
MLRATLFLVFILAGCSTPQIALEPLPPVADAAKAAEATFIRPKSIVLADTPFYLTLGDRAVFDLRDGESTRLQVASGRQALGVRCLGGPSTKPNETRLDYDFAPGGAAFFVVEPKFDCASLTPIDPKKGENLAGYTRFRGVGTVSRTAQTSAVPALAVGTATAAVPLSALPASTPVPGSAKDQVAAATAGWVEAFNKRDLAGIAARYDADAVLWGTASQRLSVGPAAIGEYFKSAQRSGERVTLGEQQIRVYGEIAIDTGSYTFWESRDGKSVAVPARYTLVYRNRENKWLIVDHHSSLVPPP